MNASGWLLTIGLMAGSFLPMAGARSERAKQTLLAAGIVVALIIGSLAIWTSAEPSGTFFPSGAGWAFLLVAIPLGLGVSAAGLALVITKRSCLGRNGRVMLAMLAFCVPPAVLVWQLRPWG